MTISRIKAVSILLMMTLVAYAEDSAPVADDELVQVEALFEHFNEGKQPGAAALVIKDGQVVFMQGFGYADIDNDVRISADSSFRLGSVSKQFTTTAIAVLAEEGKLNFDDLITVHIPELDKWPDVTVRHLMEHTSGIPDYYEKGYYDDYDHDGPMAKMSDLVEILSSYPDPDFPPGEKYVYNNGAYEVLAIIVERVSGMPFSDFLKKRVFAPAGMSTATTFNSSRPDIPNRVFGYSKTESGYELNDYDAFNDMLGDGGVYATLLDFIAWDNSLYANSVVSGDIPARS